MRHFCKSISFGSLVLLALLVRQPQAIAQATANTVLKDGEITIGIHNAAPWGYVNKEGKAAGLGPDTITAVLGPLGVKKVNFVVMEWGALIPSLMTRRIDAVASGMAITEERCKQVIFTNPDVATHDGLLVLTGNPHNIHSYEDIVKNPSLVASGLRGNSVVARALQAGIPANRMLQFPDTHSAVTALLAGRTVADAETWATAAQIVKDPALAGKIEVAKPFTGLVRNGEEVADYAAVAFRPEDKSLRDAYNESQQKLKRDGTLQRILINDGFADLIVPPGVTPQKLYPNCQ